MTIFLGLLGENDKSTALLNALRSQSENRYEVDPQSFSQISGSPFAYWLTDDLRRAYVALSRFESEGREAKQGLATTDDFRFIRAWWEVSAEKLGPANWAQFARSGGAVRYYGPSPLVIRWLRDGCELKALITQRYGNAGKRIYNEAHYFTSGFCWPLRGTRLSVKAVGPDSVFGIASKMAFVPTADRESFLAIMNSTAFDSLLRIQAGSVGGIQYESGLVAGVPVPRISDSQRNELSSFARRIWLLNRFADSVNETSHAFLLPSLLQVDGSNRSENWAVRIESVAREIVEIQVDIDNIVFAAYGFDLEAQRALAGSPNTNIVQIAAAPIEDSEDDSEEQIGGADPSDLTWELYSWSVGVAFGRFDERQSFCPRSNPLEPEPFEPLPAKSPGMLPDGATPFHSHAGILIDDPGHRDDLVQLVEQVLARVEMPAQDDLRRWLQKDFFAFHLQRYSKSRRKAPIYWPLATASGSYTLWLYYPSLGPQTLYTAINDFVEPKLAQVAGDVAALRNKGSARSRDEEKRFEAAESLELELIELRDQLLKIAPSWHPNHDDGVQITAAPLWPLFRHKPWQKILKETWAKLEIGDYDWAHMSMSYWPDRVREKCKTDKSLAIAHGLEALYIEPPPKAAAKRGRKAREA